MKNLYKVKLEKTFIIIFFFILYATITSQVYAQFCGPNVPTLTVDLTGSPDSVWISPGIIRNDNCCGTSNPDRCIQFIVTLDSAAQGISFNVYSGAMPPGALFYQIGCGPATPVGVPICLSGVGPHYITFCKPGNNQNQYSITSIPGPVGGTDLVVNDGCTGSITAVGYNEPSITWTSVFPGSNGAYNSYLSCASGCSTTQVTAQSGYPPYVDYRICGIPAALCNTTVVCDTVRVYFNPTLFANIMPVNPTVCFGQTGTTITANGTGGTPPYSYQWNTGATTQSIFVNTGTYTVIVSDTSGCPPTTTSITVTGFPSAITANAGPDQTVCSATPVTTLNGTVTAASGGIWSGGSGTFNPGNTALNAIYTPSATEITNGIATLILTTTGNGSCPPASDTMVINIINFQAAITMSTTNVSCNGGNDGTATATITGGPSPFTYSWNTNPVQSTSTATGLAAGTYTVSITDGNGCPGSGSVTITQPVTLTATTTQTNVSCYLGNNGSATVTVYGGIPGYSYSWAPSGGTGAVENGLAAGTYTVTITDANNCQTTTTVTITQPPIIIASISSTANASCNGGSNGSATVTPSGGTPAYSYLWSPGAATSITASGLAAGSYTVTVTDANGCQAIANTTITQPPLLTATTSQTNVSCNGGSNASAVVIPSGGTSPYTYSWSPGGSINDTATGLSAGTYFVTVTDFNSCQITQIVTITQPPVLTASITNINNVSCNGGNNGSATVAVSGGTSGYTYSWSPIGGNTSTGTNLTAGNYSVTVTDANACLTTSSVTITQPSAALTTTTSQFNVSCFGGSNGSATVTPSGGTAPYTYAWVPGGGTNSTTTGLSAGSYTITVTDIKNCQATNTVTITQPSALILTTGTVNATCNLANGQAFVSVTGGVPGYSYSWSPGGATNDTATGLASGSYTITVTDANSCTQSKIVNVNNTAGPTASIFSVTDVSCYGGNDGSATVTQFGGTPPYTYSWAPFGGIDSTATGLIAGIYTVTVTDSNGCRGVVTTSPQVTEPPPLSLSTTQTNVSCFSGSNGNATVSVSGGTSGYFYSWSPSGGTGATANGLTAGTYTVFVTDANSCLDSAIVTLTQPTAVISGISATTNVSCNGGNNGSATVTASGGTGGYTYNWLAYGGTSPTAIGLVAGNYTVTSTDANGCSNTIGVTITQPAVPLQATTTKTNVSCNGGSNGTAIVVPSGGTSPYTYSWSPGGSINDTVTGLSSGNHFVTVTDAKGCQIIKVVTITQPPVLNVSTTNIVNSYCGQSNGHATASVSGGSGPYSYSWAPTGGINSTATGLQGGSYTVTVTDANNCAANAFATITDTPGVTAGTPSSTNVSCYGGSNGTATVTPTLGATPYNYSWAPYGGSNATATGLMIGTYTVTITDANGCTVSVSATINQPSQLTSSITSVLGASCNGASNGSATVSAAGGTTNYSYSWNSTPVQTTATASLSAGTYTVTVTDQLLCTTSSTATITQPSQLVASISSSSNASCFGSNNGYATASAAGGTPSYTYSWNTNPVQLTQTAVNLSPGTYTVTIIDSLGCNTTKNVTITQPTPVITSAQGDTTICIGESVTISSFASGGGGGYFYLWNQGLGVSNSHTVSPSATTNYIVTAYDNQGCVGIPDTATVSVISLTQANLTVNGTTPICPGTSTLIYATVSGAIAGTLTYTWNHGLGTGPGAFQLYPIVPTTYVVTVTNTCSVTITDSVIIMFKPLPEVQIASDLTEGCGPLVVQFADSSIITTDAIVTWLWNFGDGTTSTLQNPEHIYTQTGSYTVNLTVVTSGGCSQTSTNLPYIITVFPDPIAAFTVNTTTVFLPNEPVLTSNQSINGFTYFWDFGDGATATQENPAHNYTEVGTYKITLVTTSQLGCKDTASLEIIATSKLVFPNAFTPNPDGPNGGMYDKSSLSNQVFFPYTAGVEEFHLMIFNRWGELIFESKDLKIGWDGYYRGMLSQQDVYVWKAVAKFNDGRIFNKAGDVTLLR